MATNTREKIIEAALRLFNEHGLDGVSIGDIAAELHISKGNITYYFARKQDILRELIPAHEWIDFYTYPKSLEELLQFLVYAQEHAESNIFFFKHYTQIAQMSPEVKEGQRALHRKINQCITDALRDLEEKGLVKPQMYPGQHLHVAESLLLTSVYWVPFSELREDAGIDVTEQCVGLLRLLLTEEGDAELRRVVLEKYPESLSTII